MNKGFESVSDILNRAFQHWQVHQPLNDLKILPTRCPQRNISYLPTIMTRLSPFFPISKRQMKIDSISEPIIIENPWGRIIITGRRLSIYDETVMLSLMALLKRTGSNTIRTTPYELCKIMGVNTARDTYNAILKSLYRMSQSHITIERKVSRSNDAQKEMDGLIIIDITKNEESRKMILELNPYFLSSFRNRLITPIDIKLRSELRGDIAKALYRFFEGQRANCYTINIVKLSKAINLDCHRQMYSLRWGMRKAMRELEVQGYLRRFILPDKGNVVAIFKSRYREL